MMHLKAQYFLSSPPNSKWQHKMDDNNDNDHLQMRAASHRSHHHHHDHDHNHPNHDHIMILMLMMMASEGGSNPDSLSSEPPEPERGAASGRWLSWWSWWSSWSWWSWWSRWWWLRLHTKLERIRKKCSSAPPSRSAPRIPPQPATASPEVE